MALGTGMAVVDVSVTHPAGVSNSATASMTDGDAAVRRDWATIELQGRPLGAEQSSVEVSSLRSKQAHPLAPATCSSQIRARVVSHAAAGPRDAVRRNAPPSLHLQTLSLEAMPGIYESRQLGKQRQSAGPVGLVVIIIVRYCMRLHGAYRCTCTTITGSVTRTQWRQHSQVYMNLSSSRQNSDVAPTGREHLIAQSTTHEARTRLYQSAVPAQHQHPNTEIEKKSAPHDWRRHRVLFIRLLCQCTPTCAQTKSDVAIRIQTQRTVTAMATPTLDQPTFFISANRDAR
jgi:hypothetical protein